MDEDAEFISLENVQHSPVLKVRTDIFTEEVEVVTGSAEEEKEEGEVNTSLSSVSSDELSTDSVTSSSGLNRTEGDQNPPPPFRQEKRKLRRKRKFKNDVQTLDVQYLCKRIQEKQIKIAQLVKEIADDQSLIDKIKKLKATEAKISRQEQEAKTFWPKYCEQCNVTAHTDETWQSHLNGKRHRNRVREKFLYCEG